MARLVVALSGVAAVSAFTPTSLPAAPVVRTSSPMMAEETLGRRQLFSKAAGAAALFSAAAANAEVDYAGVGYLGGSSIIDVNNANIRVYQKLPGMYPNACSKLIKNVPYKSKEELYTKAKLA